MTQIIDDYIFELDQHLTKLPQKEREDVVEFYREFLLDGDFVRRSTIETELGTPKQLAYMILADYSLSEESDQTVEQTHPRSNLKAIWYILLGICAAPIGIPLVIALALVIFAIFCVGFSLIIALLAVILGLLIGGGVILFKSFTFLFTSNWAVGFFYIGIALIGVGIALLLAPGIKKMGEFMIAKCTIFVRYLGRKVFKTKYYQDTQDHKEYK